MSGGKSSRRHGKSTGDSLTVKLKCTTLWKHLLSHQDLTRLFTVPDDCVLRQKTKHFTSPHSHLSVNWTVCVSCLKLPKCQLYPPTVSAGVFLCVCVQINLWLNSCLCTSKMINHLLIVMDSSAELPVLGLYTLSEIVGMRSEAWTVWNILMKINVFGCAKHLPLRCGDFYWHLSAVKLCLVSKKWVPASAVSNDEVLEWVCHLWLA